LVRQATALARPLHANIVILDQSGRARFFALLSEQQIKRGAHRSVAELEDAITAYIKSRNAAPKPFRWTKSADDILTSIERFCRRTLDSQARCA
jgi:hypothetical protein